MSSETMTSQRQSSTGTLLRRLLSSYVRPYFGRLMLAMFFMAVTAATTAVNAWLMKPVVDGVLVDRDEAMLLVVTIAVLAIALVKGVATYIQGFLSGAIGQYIIADVQKDLYAHLMRADLSYFQSMASGQLVAKFLNDAYLLRDAVSRALTGIAKDSLSAVFLIGVMFYHDWQLAMMTFVAFPIAIIPVRNFGKRMRKVSTTMQERTGLFSALLTETLQGVRHIKAYGMEAHESARTNAAIDFRMIPMIKGLKIRAGVTPLMEALGGIAVATVIYYGGSRVIEGAITAGELFSFLTALLMAYQPIKSLANLNTALQEGLSAADRIFQLMDKEPEIDQSPEAQELEIRTGSISFDHVSFDYSDGTQALNDVSLSIPAGNTVALVGASGSGKSTMLNLIPRFYDASKGAIRIDDQDVRDVTLNSLRSAVALVTQDATLFDDTIRANIAYGRPSASDAEIHEAAKGAAADGFIADLGQGYDTNTGEDGTRLSGGQRQRIAIARAMLKDAPILLLDEATSALDSESERKVQDALRALMKGRTTLVVAHRLSTIIDADVIHVLEGGRIIESGSHSELLARSGAYARLWQLQSGGQGFEAEPAAVQSS